MKNIESETKKTDPEMYKTSIFKVPKTVMEEEFSIDSHNAKSEDLSEIPSTVTEKLSNVAENYKERL